MKTKYRYRNPSTAAAYRSGWVKAERASYFGRVHPEALDCAYTEQSLRDAFRDGWYDRLDPAFRGVMQPDPVAAGYTWERVPGYFTT